MAVTLKNYHQFCQAMSQRESAGQYDCKNRFGFLGAYQFGMARLCDLGLTERIPGRKGYSNSSFQWRAGFSESRFLSDKDLQDSVFEAHVNSLRRWVVSKYSHLLTPDSMVGGVAFTVSGAVAVCHLLGYGGLMNLVKGVDGTDALGTKATDYLTLFSGYDLSGLQGSTVLVSRYGAKPLIS